MVLKITSMQVNGASNKEQRKLIFTIVSTMDAIVSKQ